MNRKERRAAGKGEITMPLPAQALAERAFATALDHHRKGRPDKALDFYREAARLAPNEAEPPYNLGLALYQLGRPEEAVAAWRAAINRRPGYVRALVNMGIALAELGRLAEARAALEAALAAGGDMAEAWNNLAIVWRDLGETERATDGYLRALALKPDYADAVGNLGISHLDAGRTDEAIAAFRRALRLEPDHARAHFNLGLALLRSGDFAQGWREHEWRWQGGARHLQARAFRQPEWRGESLAGRTILLYAEQGYGDAIQFARFAKPVADLGGRVIVEVPAGLKRLFETLPGAVEIVASGDQLPRFDCHLSLMSVPRVLDIRLDTIPSETPYLAAAAPDVRRWAERLADGDKTGGRTVGLVWAGDPRPHDHRAHAIDQRRSIALERLASLLKLPGIRWISLQKGAASGQIATLVEDLRPFDGMAEVADFADTAGLIANLDLVISVDTAVAHLAGALGKPVWILSRFDGCWRWLEGRDDSPWYKTARLFRQTAPGAWDEVIARVADTLK